MKTIELLQVLTVSELKHFEKKVINFHKRNSLKKLYLYLKKHQKIEKEKAFKKVFDLAYTPQKDALFRNELRLLNKELELFMLEEQWRKNLSLNSNESQLTLIKLYLERKEFTLFEQAWRKLYKKAKGERLYSIKIDLINLFFQYKTNYVEVDEDLYQELKILIEEAMRTTVAQMQIAYKKLELKDAFVQRTMYAQRGRKYTYQKVVSYYKRENELENDDMVAFLDYRIQSYFLNGLEKIETLQKALSYSKDLEVKYPKDEALREAIVVTEMTIALEFFLLEEYQKADTHYLQLLGRKFEMPDVKKAVIYFNYISNLICLEAYDRAIDFYEKNKKVCSETRICYRLQYMLCWAYIMREKYEVPLKMLLDHNIKERPENDFIYARLLLAILYYSTQDMELAEREVYNLVQNHRYKTPIEKTFIDYSSLFYQHIQATYVLEVKKRNEKLTKVQDQLDIMYKANASSASTMMFRWLTRQNKRAML